MRPLIIALGAVLVAITVRYGYLSFYTQTKPPAAPAASKGSSMPEEYLSPHLRILMFYQTDPAAPLGRPLTVCYGVLNAVSVALDPRLAELKPALNHCFPVTVERPRMLMLAATGKDGERAAAALMLGSRLPRPAFTAIQLSTLTPRRGEKVTLCYGTNSATSVHLLPSGPPLRPGARVCADFAATEPHYTLAAESKGGRDEASLPFKYKD